MPTTKNLNSGGASTTRKKYTPAFKAECVRQVSAGARQTDVAQAQGISPALLGRWQRQALEQAMPNNVNRNEINRLHAELKRAEMARDILKKSYDHLFPTAPVMSRYRFMAACLESCPVQVLYRTLGVSPAGYYQYQQRPAPVLVA